MEEDLVSVVMPAHNSSSYIAKSITSVLMQTYTKWELLVIDDVSSDTTSSIVQSFADKDGRIKLIKLSDHHGPALARNVGIEEAKGRYIAFLDSDDVWLPEKLQKHLQFMQKHDLALSYTSYYLMDENGVIVDYYKAKAQVSYKDLLKVNYIGCSTVIYDVDKLGKRYMKPIRHEDYALWLQILREVGYTKGLVEPLTVYLVGQGISSSKWKSASWRWNIYKNELHMGTIEASWYYVVYVVNGLLKFGRFRFKKRKLIPEGSRVLTLDDLIDAE